jgi:hypothetical protein
MTWFEVFIPAKDDDGLNVTLTVEAPNWIGALRTGLANIGEGQEAISNVMCDIKEDNSIHVTNPSTSRVFRLKETAAPADKKAAAAPKPAAPAEVLEAPEPIEEVVEAKAEKAPPSHAAKATAQVPRPDFTAGAEKAGAKKAGASKAPPSDAKTDKVEKVEKAPPPKRTTGQFSEAPVAADRKETKRTKEQPAIGRVETNQVRIDDIIADIFEATQELQWDGKVQPKKVAEKLLELALQKVPAESGTFYLADINGKELSFEAVSGPKADALKKSKLKVPVGQGVIGFCAQEGICLVIEDMENDKHYFSGIADAIGYQPKNTLCSSAEKNGRLYGAIQLINSKKGKFGPAEMEIIRYVGLTAAEMLDRAFEQE